MQSHNLDDVLKPHVDLDANVQLHLTSSVTSSANFPHLEADFRLVWMYHTGGANNGVQALGFDNVRLNLGEFVSRTITPLLQDINSTLKPLLPIAQVLGTPLPVLSDLAGSNVTLLDLWYNVETIMVGNRLQNVANKMTGPANQAWNVHEWDLK